MSGAIPGKVFRGALYPDPYALMKALAPLEGKRVLIEVWEMGHGPARHPQACDTCAECGGGCKHLPCTCEQAMSRKRGSRRRC